MNATINSIGIYHPAQKVYNTYFEERLETSDKWIKERTGIESRFFASSDEYTSDMCVQAAIYNPQIQISAESETKRSIFREKDKTKRSKKESAQHSKSRNKSFVMTSVSAL